MSDPIEINKAYRDLGEEDKFVSYARLAGGDPHTVTYPAEENKCLEGEVPADGETDKAEAEEILRQAREERDRILAGMEDLKKKAYEEGYADGQAEGRRQGREEYAERLGSTATLINELEEALKKLVAGYETELHELIKIMVERLVCREIEEDKAVIREVLDRALDYIVENTNVTVRLNRADIERLKGGEEEMIPGEGRSKVELVEDNSISVGGCLVMTGSGEVDATLENRRDILFAAVDKALNQ